MIPRVRLTSNGYVKVKFPGRKSRMIKVPFLDDYRRRSFRNLLYTLDELGFHIVGEKNVRRYFDLNLGISPMRVWVEDTVLVTALSPTSELVKKYPALTKPAYIITFIYDGDGRFNTIYIYEEKEEFEALKEFFQNTVYPNYVRALIFDEALTDREKPEGEREENPPFHGMIEVEGKEEEDPKPKEKAETKKRKRRVKKRLRTRRKAERVEPEPSLEEIKEKISRYRPEDFKSKLAYERYLQALKEAPDREEDIHRLFYSLIAGKKDFKNYYLQLYRLAPKLLETVQAHISQV